MTPEENIRKVAADLNLEMVSAFVPWSKSRNKDKKLPSLNWKVSLLRNKYLFLQVDYSAGCAHAPSYKQSNLMRDKKLIEWECEHGYRGKIGETIDYIYKAYQAKPLTPNLADVLYSVVLDSDVIEYGSFEEWACEFGYDPDSRKAETMYRACLDTALKLRQGIGEAGLKQLREATQDY